ncbi:uncharacterized protein K489DRAFT_379425, partial [Dissoconium aciculare CBS 342.82]|uniref:Uncharacterized protein n=1 Tax=Dissoconium aciculare CBS 342.82 TaxID=1314786 RepID=A0A6J3M5V4_9PEZI
MKENIKILVGSGRAMQEGARTFLFVEISGLLGVFLRIFGSQVWVFILSLSFSSSFLGWEFSSSCLM